MVLLALQLPARTPGPDAYFSSFNHVLFLDIKPDPEDNHLFHRAEAGLAESLFPLQRPEVLYIFGEKSRCRRPSSRTLR